VRLIWLLMIESHRRDADGDAPDPLLRSRLVRWAVVGLAVVGVAAVIVYRLTR
jgi:hypothetical protein